MPSFDIVSQVDHQEVRNALDQAVREIGTRFDFKNTDTKFDLNDKEGTITIESESEQRLKAAIQVLEEKFVKRQVSLKSLNWGSVEEATKGRARQKAKIVEGITKDKAKEIGKFIKDQFKKLSHSIQGEQVRVQGKKRDELQDCIQELKGKDFGIPLQFINFRD